MIKGACEREIDSRLLLLPLHLITTDAVFRSRLQAKPRFRYREMRRYRVSNTHCPNTLNTRSKIVCSIILLRRVLLRFGWRCRHPKDVRPLLQGLVVVLGRQRPVNTAMPELHARPCSVVAWVHASDDIAPVLRSRYTLATRACVVPSSRCSGGRHKTACRDA